MLLTTEQIHLTASAIVPKVLPLPLITHKPFAFESLAAEPTLNTWCVLNMWFSMCSQGARVVCMCMSLGPVSSQAMGHVFL